MPRGRLLWTAHHRLCAIPHPLHAHEQWVHHGCQATGCCRLQVRRGRQCQSRRLRVGLSRGRRRSTAECAWAATRCMRAGGCPRGATDLHSRIHRCKQINVSRSRHLTHARDSDELPSRRSVECSPQASTAIRTRYKRVHNSTVAYRCSAADYCAGRDIPACPTGRWSRVHGQLHTEFRARGRTLSLYMT